MSQPRPTARRAFLAAALLVAPLVAGCAQRAARGSGGATEPAVTEQDLRTRLFIFADDSMQGREAGTAGHEKGLRYIEGELRRLGVQPAGEQEYSQTVPVVQRRRGADGTITVDTVMSRNLIAVIEGSDPVLKNEYVAIGGHSDHVGFRANAVDHDSLRAFNQALWALRGKDANTRGNTPEQRNSVTVNVDSLRRIRPARLDSINNGADDDGSGSMAVLELAEWFQAMPVKPKRSILLVWHTAEEKGLIGARHFMDNPTVPREQIVAQLNIDMIGRGVEGDVKDGSEDYLTVLGPKRLSTELDATVKRVNQAQPRPLTLDYGFDADGHPQQFYCRSDHYHYARYGVPIAFFFTNIHEDYHQATDEPQYIAYPKYARITRYIGDIAMTVANQAERPVVDGVKQDPNGRCRQ